MPDVLINYHIKIKKKTKTQELRGLGGFRRI